MHHNRTVLGMEVQQNGNLIKIVKCFPRIAPRRQLLRHAMTNGVLRFFPSEVAGTASPAPRRKGRLQTGLIFR